VCARRRASRPPARLALVPDSHARAPHFLVSLRLATALWRRLLQSWKPGSGELPGSLLRVCRCAWDIATLKFCLFLCSCCCPGCFSMEDSIEEVAREMYSQLLAVFGQEGAFSLAGRLASIAEESRIPARPPFVAAFSGGNFSNRAERAATSRFAPPSLELPVPRSGGKRARLPLWPRPWQWAGVNLPTLDSSSAGGNTGFAPLYSLPPPVVAQATSSCSGEAVGSVAQAVALSAEVCKLWAREVRQLAATAQINNLFPSDSDLLDYLSASAPSTLKRHWKAWSVWSTFCSDRSLSRTSPDIESVRYFLQDFLAGRSLRAVQSSFRFVGHKLRVARLLVVLQEVLPVLEARAQVKGQPRGEAPPWPLQLQAALELELQTASCDQQVCWLGGLLLCAQAGLRFSDAQRVRLSEITEDAISVRGWVFRSKSRRFGFAFGVVKCGVSGADWPSKWLAAARRFLRNKDFLLPPGKGFARGKGR
jgi:hypothetical protein